MNHETDLAALSELGRRLEANGTVVVPYKDYLEIRPGHLTRVKVRIVDGRLSCEPLFGFIPRERGTWAALAAIGLLIIAMLHQLGVTPESLMLGFLGVIATTSIALRFQLTEACITRVQTAFMLMTSGAPSALPPGPEQWELPALSLDAGVPRAEPRREASPLDTPRTRD
jgi:hypothetical protein